MLRGDVPRAVDLLLDSLDRCVRLPDGYLWGKAYALDTLARLAVRERIAGASGWVDDLMSLASDTGMREFVVRAHRYRGKLGDEASAVAARLLAGEIDNPRLNGPGQDADTFKAL